MKIIELKVSNFLRIEAAEIRPDGNLVVIAGPNEAGKSSVGVKAIWAALGGKDATPEKPIRDGAKRGSITLTIGRGDDAPRLVVERVFTAGGTRIAVSELRPDGASATFRSPQKMLDALIESLAFDPHRFSQLTPGGQAELLSQITGLDVSDLDAEYERMYAERRDANRDIKMMGECPGPNGERPEPVDVDTLLHEMTEAREALNRNLDSVRRLESAKASLDEVRRKATDIEHEIQRLTVELKRVRETAIPEAVKRAEQLAERVESEGKPEARITELEQQLRDAQARNESVRAYDAVAARFAERKQRHAVADGLSQRLDAIKAKRAERIAAVDMPLDGLAIEDGVVTLDGQPLSQASTARQIEVGARIAAAQNPRLRVMRIEQGSMLDSKMLQTVGELAESLNMQVWVERVADSDDGTGFYIEDGRVAERETDRQESLL